MGEEERSGLKEELSASDDAAIELARLVGDLSRSLEVCEGLKNSTGSGCGAEVSKSKSVSVKVHLIENAIAYAPCDPYLSLFLQDAGSQLKHLLCAFHLDLPLVTAHSQPLYLLENLASLRFHP